MDRLRRAVSLHSPQLGVPPLSIKRLLRKVPGTLRAASLARKFPRRSLDPEPPAVRSGAHCGGGKPATRLDGERRRTKVKDQHRRETTMSNETTLTITGNLVDDPELRFTPAGQPVARFRIASDASVLRQGIRPVEGRRLAVPHLCRVAPGRGERRREHDPGHPGDRDRAAPPAVLRDQGRRQAHRLRTRGGRGRGVSLRNATAKVSKVTRTSGGEAQAARRGRGEDADPWASEAPGGYSGEPPF